MARFVIGMWWMKQRVYRTVWWKAWWSVRPRVLPRVDDVAEINARGIMDETVEDMPVSMP